MIIDKQINIILYVIFICFICAIFIEFVFFMYKPLYCVNNKESFSTNCVDSNIILLSEILTDNRLDSISQLQKIQQIPFSKHANGEYVPVIQSNKIKPDDKIESLKQIIMQNYILKCNDPKYNNMSKINDIKYLDSNNSSIKQCLQNKKDPSFQILEIDEILRQNKYT